MSHNDYFYANFVNNRAKVQIYREFSKINCTFAPQFKHIEKYRNNENSTYRLW